MSTDNVFRTKEEVSSSAQEERFPVGKNSSASGDITHIEVPYLDYENQNLHPYSADYFNLGSTWDDPVGGFPNEVKKIESYVKEKINSGEVANSISAIKGLLKGMERVNNLSKEERAVVKVEVLANYVEFLMKNDMVKRNLRRYGST